MIRLITGKPGSGKSYFAVWEITKRFFKWDNELFSFVPISDVIIFTNIDNLKLKHISLEFYLKKHNISLETFFTVEFQQKLLEKYKNVIYLIDEAQKYFPKNFKDNNVLFLFQYHRHLGLDFYLITQDIKLICPLIVSLIEYEIQAQRRVKTIGNFFTYFYIVDNEIINKKRIKHDYRIFSLYSSFQSDETIKDNPQPIKKYLILISLFFLISIFLFFFVFRNSFFPSSSITKNNNTHIINKKFIKKDNIHHKNKINNFNNLKKKTINNQFDFIGKNYNFRFYSKFSNSPLVKIHIGSFPNTFIVYDNNYQPYKIHLFGETYTINNFPYPYLYIKKNSQFFVYIPQELLNIFNFPQYFIARYKYNINSELRHRRSNEGVLKLKSGGKK